MLNMGGPSTVCFFALRPPHRAAASVTINPGLRNLQLSKKSLLRRGHYSSSVSIRISTMDSQKTDSTDRKAVHGHWRWFSYSTLDRVTGGGLGSVTR